MKPAIIDGKCRLKGRYNCTDCRLHAEWRRSVGTPEVCPHGIDLTNLPLPAAKVTVRKKGCRTCPPVAVGG